MQLIYYYTISKYILTNKKRQLRDSKNSLCETQVMTSRKTVIAMKVSTVYFAIGIIHSVRTLNFLKN